jgi:ketosteroid isomerase-like protein
MPEQGPEDLAGDRAEILAHIHTIFDAFIRQDREALRRTHTADWTGFQNPSKQIERGIEAYMKNAELSLQTLCGTGFEILESSVQVHGDLAIVFYVARYDYRAADGHAGSVPLRSMDIYVRKDGGWIQSGSHIGVIPAAATWTEAG